MKLKQGDRIVFIGDSITHAGRNEDPNGLGFGYVKMISDELIKAGMHIKIVNKGENGDRVIDLADRWQEDVIDIQPDWVSVSIGINDVWRQLDQPSISQIYPEAFTNIYEDLLDQVKNKTAAKIILMEPTIIEEDVMSKGNELLKPYVHAVHRLVEKYDCIIVPTHYVFIEALRTKSHGALTTDGVHMTPEGDKLIAHTWLKSIR
ncbi:SGNH/GDSL hydrolase family protein [Evansella cellulosilytica]|uniref:Lipolytic protein G-D-S-L family n=1 Tax=Evansella cellulosilytica (strain ATCC 21833 / DSM 2522 / FERM P-1141 / JCM 9156 / N-4) TaxID=649639 RepID=E6U1V7_EVAC2|nr:SGNH/GDSL hydrolase family protein [Evansella cellulosilytica]ADU31604.1 lipolytic protein G-D-S-L family [Evansella cellulosilytica DSM 2522]